MKNSNSVDVDSSDEDYDEEKLKLFLDFLLEEVDKDPCKLIPYTIEMDAEFDKLLKGVDIGYTFIIEFQGV